LEDFMAKTPEIGAAAPDFTLPSVELIDTVAVRGLRTLSAMRGRPMVLAFYPGDETLVCTKQMCAYTNELDQFRNVDAVVWGISVQDLDSHERFALRHELGFPLLADVEHEVTTLYGVDGFGLGTRRSVFVIDADGVLRWKFVGLIGATYPSATKIAEQVAAVRV
jgi:peroxiredoxin Q/BCP